MGAQPSIPRDTSRKLEVIDMGYARTATMSFAMAFEELLDGPAMHGGTQMFNREDAYCRKLSLLYKYRREGDRVRLMKTLQEVIGGFVGCADCPMIHFLPELMELYPDAKVVLVTRDRESWWKSFSVFGDETAKSAVATFFLQILLFPIPGARWFPSIVKGFEEDLWRVHGLESQDGLFLEKHNAWVRQQVPKDKLLEMDLAAGWEPLCRFLGKPVPTKPFPRANDREARDRFMRYKVAQASVAWIGILSTVAFAGHSAWRFWRR
ncbi:hypothetical protein JX265_006086 [Neoarthrinium moseri]|uniref:NAD dependent epimerase/dehydratase n=1 Tax=Neoarthrinium moseri TaxID=1658444 RepID=A0A9Q0AMA1_9PEZI|nr:uncharacterized protein JN550_004301 [Neoarthrinium moseri]KAI1871046.1 hypothetical protein JX265_006086 [Neoarthrinium moseri]KAI1872098.1 hypothetical protein JN550_004301 [Neoarthrinium moseri]